MVTLGLVSVRVERLGGDTGMCQCQSGETRW